MNIQLDTQDKVWKYINRIPKNPLDNSIDIIYSEHCFKLGLTEIELRNILNSFGKRGLINFNGYFGGAIIMFPL